MSARRAALATLVATLAGCSLVHPPEPDVPASVTAPAAPSPEFHAPPLDAPAVATAPMEARSLLGNAPFYDVDGHRYFVRDGSVGDMERGVASWYGRKFHGRRTANGERFDMHDMTAAHRTLPLPSRVRVTNLETGRSVIVRVNDRGPFKDGRIIDLSHAAARKLGISGIGKVEVRRLTHAEIRSGSWKLPTAPRVASSSVAE